MASMPEAATTLRRVGEVGDHPLEVGLGRGAGEGQRDRAEHPRRGETPPAGAGCDGSGVSDLGGDGGALLVHRVSELPQTGDGLVAENDLTRAPWPSGTRRGRRASSCPPRRRPPPDGSR